MFLLTPETREHLKYQIPVHMRITGYMYNTYIQHVHVENFYMHFLSAILYKCCVGVNMASSFSPS